MDYIHLKDGNKIFYVKKGVGLKKVFFIHGNMANTFWWKQTLDVLSAEYTAVAIDLPGSGLSPETGIRHTMEYFVDIVKEVIDFLNWNEFYLVGHSMGGGVSQLFTLNYPQKIKKLVLLNSMAADGFHVLYKRGYDRMRSLMDNKEKLASAIRGIAPMCKDKELLNKVIDKSFLASYEVFIEQPVTMHEANWMDRLGEIKCPVLFLHGDQDNFVPKEGSERTAKAIPNCHFEYLGNCGHSPMLEVFDVYFKKLFNFLNSD